MFNATNRKILVHYPTKKNKKENRKINEVINCLNVEFQNHYEPIFKKQHLILRYWFYERRRDANTFPARKYILEPYPLFSHASESSFINFNKFLIFIER